MDEKIDIFYLEEQIAQKISISKYYFDEKTLCFIGDATVQLYLFELSKGCYRSCDIYLFNEYEIKLTDEQTKDLVFYGDKKIVMQSAIDKFNKESPTFMGYNVIYKNISVIFEDKQHLLD